MTNLTEIIVQDLSGKTDNPHRLFVGWQEKLFILDDDSDTTPVKAHLSRHPAFQENYSGDSVYDLVSYAGSDMPPDVVAGTYEPRDRSLYIYGSDKANPATSVILRKIVKQLKIKSIRKTDSITDDDVYYSTKKMVGGIPSVGYHGTNTENLEGILERGIKPGAGIGNFELQQIHHETEVFFAATFEDAVYYSINSLYDYSRKRGWGPMPKKPNTYQAVLKVKLPDPNKIVPDYDAESHSVVDKDSPHYTHTGPPEHFGPSPMKAMTLSKEMGKFGYSGRILPSFIEWVYIWSDEEETWKKFKPATVKRLFGQLGTDWFYRYGIGTG
jgi:hypothetical protein